MIKAMIVDDKTAAIELLRWLIRENCPEITSIASAVSVAEALPLIDNFEPDILFLDIQMPQETGFDLLAKVKKWGFEVIFTTAFNEYAIQAIRFSALDYLLKPVDPDELRAAVLRHLEKKESTEQKKDLFDNLVSNMGKKEVKNFKIAVPCSEGV